MSRSRAATVALTVIALGSVCAVAAARFVRDDDARRHYLAATGWPTHGQAAYRLDDGRTHVSPGEEPVPIASVAKVMTALLVLRAHPLHRGSDGFRLRVTRRDVADTLRRADDEESIVGVWTGEVLTERQALAALLLPSANNVAIMLARAVSGSVRRFVVAMNATARRLGMRHTRYTDPSGLTSTTVSTAADQVVLADVAMRNATFAGLVGRTSFALPHDSTVENTDFLVGTHGFVGIKTGSDDAAGGCFVFRAHRMRHGHPVTVTGVVLGQHGDNLISAGLYAGLQLVDRVAA